MKGLQPKTGMLLRLDNTVQELVKIIRTDLLEDRKGEPTAAQLNSESNDCLLAIKTINEKLSQYIEELPVGNLAKRAQRGSVDCPLGRSSVDSRVAAKEKLLAAYGQQIQYYEQEIGRLELYKTKITEQSYDSQLSQEMAEIKGRIAELTKATSELRLKVGGMVGRVERRQGESQYKRNEQLFRLKYLEEKVSKLGSSKNSKENFLKHLEDENNKLVHKINAIKAERGADIEMGEFERKRKAVEVSTRLARIKELNSHLEDKLKRQIAGLHSDNDRLRVENGNLKATLAKVSRAVEEQEKQLEGRDTDKHSKQVLV